MVPLLFLQAKPREPAPWTAMPLVRPQEKRLQVQLCWDTDLHASSGAMRPAVLPRMLPGEGWWDLGHHNYGPGSDSCIASPAAPSASRTALQHPTPRSYEERPATQVEGRGRGLRPAFQALEDIATLPI